MKTINLAHLANVTGGRSSHGSDASGFNRAKSLAVLKEKIDAAGPYLTQDAIGRIEDLIFDDTKAKRGLN